MNLQMSKEIVSFIIKLTAFLGLTFGAHLAAQFFLDGELFQHAILLCYILNYVLAIIIFLGLFILNKKHGHILGYIFMGGSFVKFGVYFLLVQPIYKLDGTTTKWEFATFFIPYAVALIVETISLLSFLKKSE